MGMVRNIALPWTTVASASASAKAVPASAWMPAAQSTEFRGTVEIRNRCGGGAIEVALGIQTADVENTPSDHVNAGDLIVAFQTNEGVAYPSDKVNLVGLTKGKQLYRLVWYVKLTSGANLTTARVGGKVEVWLAN